MINILIISDNLCTSEYFSRYFTEIYSQCLILHKTNEATCDNFSLFKIVVIECNRNHVKVCSEIRFDNPDALIVLLTNDLAIVNLTIKYYPIVYAGLNTLSKDLKMIQAEISDHIFLRDYFYYHIGNTKKQIDIKYIISFEKLGNKVIMYLINKSKESFYEDIKKIEMLDYDGFYRIDKSTIINMQYITAIEDSFILMKDNKKYEVSRRKKRSFILAYDRFKKTNRSSLNYDHSSRNC